MIKFLATFFAFGTAMCVLTVVLLLFPGTALDSLWRFNPDAHATFQSIGKVAVLLMAAVGIACAFTAAGLWRNSMWGIRLALVILSLNTIGDLFNALIRHDFRSLVGVPIAGALILYLVRHQKARNSYLQ